jgi:hypothetical protein
MRSTNRQCHFDQCRVYSSYRNKAGGIHSCTTHKTPDMIPIKKMCSYCELHPSYSGLDINGQKIITCTTHKKDGMKPLHAACFYQDCATRSIYRDVNGVYACEIHKTDTMISLKRLCIYPRCRRLPKYCIGQIPIYCEKHNKINNKCVSVTCDKAAVCGNVGEKPLFCDDHKKDNMIYLETSQESKAIYWVNMVLGSACRPPGDYATPSSSAAPPPRNPFQYNI